MTEKREYLDPESGLKVIRWSGSDAKDQHLYFISPSVTCDGRWLLMLSELSGHPNLYVIDRETEELRQLSDNTDGLRHSYVYARGTDKGFSKASPCLDPLNARVVYIQDNVLIWQDVSSGTILSRRALPTGVSAYTHINPSGTHACVLLAPTSAFKKTDQTQWDQLEFVPVRLKEQAGAGSRLLEFDLVTGQMTRDVVVPFWVTHVMYDPQETGRIVFNQEGDVHKHKGAVAPRVWCLETDNTVRPLYEQPGDTWVSHENFSPTGGNVVSHGGWHGGRDFVDPHSWQGERLARFELGANLHHARMTHDGGHFVADLKNGRFVKIAPYQQVMTTLCRHDSTLRDNGPNAVDQDTHAHAIEGEAGRSVVFTSNREGSCNLYEVFYT